MNLLTILGRSLLVGCALFTMSASYASGPAPAADAQRFEAKFLTDMIDHHAMAVMMAELCETRAVHPELLALCEQIRETQMEEIVTMQMWLSDWYGIEHDPEMTAGMQKQMENLASLTGEEFEIEFMQTMIRHHWRAVVTASLCQKKAYHEELHALCEEIETAQTAEIELMGSWLSEWYGIRNNRGSDG